MKLSFSPRIYTPAAPTTHMPTGRRYAQFGNAEAATSAAVVSHETVLQGLNQWVPAMHPWITNREAYYAVENFTGTEKAWDQVPIIYVPKFPVHPSIKGLKENPDAELERIEGRVAGSLSGTRVIETGTPRLMTTAHFTDPELQQLYDQGLLGLSTGFGCPVDTDGRLYGKVEPSHVLAFDIRDDQQNDPKAMFLNTRGGSMSDGKPNDTGEIKGLLNKILARLGGETPEHTNTRKGDNMDPEMKKRLDFVNLKIEEKDREIATLKADLKEKEEKIAEFENLRKEQEQKAKDARWAEIKNLLPPGLTHEAEKEAALRKEFEGDPAAFSVRMLQMDNLRRPGTRKSGTTAPTGGTSLGDELAEIGVPSIELVGGE